LTIAIMLYAAGSTRELDAQNAASEATIRAIVADQVVAWNAGDASRRSRSDTLRS
jgi:hypothetical protein